MSVHQRGQRWIVRYREDGHNRQKSFPTQREAEAFDRQVREIKTAAVTDALRRLRASA